MRTLLRIGMSGVGRCAGFYRIVISIKGCRSPEEEAAVRQWKPQAICERR